MSKYRLLAGRHDEGGRTYKPGDIFESKSDLMRLNPANPSAQKKFEKIEGFVPTQVAVVEAVDDDAEEDDPSPQEDGLGRLSVAELREWAESEEIDLAGARTKAQILQMIRASS